MFTIDRSLELKHPPSDVLSCIGSNSSSMSFSRLIRQCAEIKSIANGKAIHAWVTVSGWRKDVQINNHLLTMYSKLGRIDYARRVFDQMPDRNIVTWTSLISAYSHMGLSDEALNCFRSMALDGGTAPNDYTYAALISACAQMGASRCGKEIHGRIYRKGEAVNNVVNNSLVNFYGKCGLLKSARLVFDAMPEANTVGWVSLMSNYIQCGDIEEGLRIFLRSLRLGVKVNEYSYGIVLGACAALEILEFGMQVQCLSIKFGVRMDQFVVTNLVNFYAKCGELELASRGLREVDKPNVPAWTALIGGCVQLGKHAEAIDLFQRMRSSGLRPNEQTFASTIGAFGKEKDILGGKQVHGFVIKMGFESFTFVSNSVLDFYAKIGRLDESLKIFCAMDGGRNTVSWNALIAGCASSGHREAAIKVIQDMFSDGFEPNIYTYSSLLSICSDLPAVEWGKQTHCCIIKPGLDSNVVVGSALVDMYAKCGRLNDARTVFDTLPNKNLVSWNAMITSYAQHGFHRQAMEIYDAMLRDAIEPNDVTFIGVLSACGHAGALEDALRYFETMTKDFGVEPRADHVASMVSLFSRKGQTREAYEFIVSSKMNSNKVVWRSLLAGCVANKDLELAVLAAEKILIIDPNDTSVRVMLSNVYADSNMWNEASQVRKIMEKKEIGFSWI